jgi:dynactin complex subunit
MLMRQLKSAELVEHLQDTLSEIEEARDSIWREQKPPQAEDQLRISWLQSLAKQKKQNSAACLRRR